MGYVFKNLHILLLPVQSTALVPRSRSFREPSCHCSLPSTGRVRIFRIETRPCDRTGTCPIDGTKRMHFFQFQVSHAIVWNRYLMDVDPEGFNPQPLVLYPLSPRFQKLHIALTAGMYAQTAQNTNRSWFGICLAPVCAFVMWAASNICIFQCVALHVPLVHLVNVGSGKV